MRKLNRAFIYTALLSTTLQGCGGGGDDAKTNAVNNGPSTELDGSWFMSCALGNPGVDPNKVPPFYDTMTATYAGSTVRFIHMRFSDTECTKPVALLAKNDRSGKFKIAPTAHGTGYKNIDLNFTLDNLVIPDDKNPDKNKIDFTVFNIFKINAGNNSFNHGALFGPNDGTTDATRPDTLVLDRTFNRQ